MKHEGTTDNVTTRNDMMMKKIGENGVDLKLRTPVFRDSAIFRGN
jgi:hypothetical protein